MTRASIRDVLTRRPLVAPPASPRQRRRGVPRVALASLAVVVAVAIGAVIRANQGARRAPDRWAAPRPRARRAGGAERRAAAGGGAGRSSERHRRRAGVGVGDIVRQRNADPDRSSESAVVQTGVRSVAARHRSRDRGRRRLGGGHAGGPGHPRVSGDDAVVQRSRSGGSRRRGRRAGRGLGRDAGRRNRHAHRSAVGRRARGLSASAPPRAPSRSAMGPSGSRSGRRRGGPARRTDRSGRADDPGGIGTIGDHGRLAPGSGSPTSSPGP